MYCPLKLYTKKNKTTKTYKVFARSTLIGSMSYRCQLSYRPPLPVYLRLSETVLIVSHSSTPVPVYGGNDLSSRFAQYYKVLVNVNGN